MTKNKIKKELNCGKKFGLKAIIDKECKIHIVYLEKNNFN